MRYPQPSSKLIHKQVNKDLKNLSNWLNANKICLNVSKTEIVLFKSATEQFDLDLKLKLGLKIDKHLTWKPQNDGISVKLNQANANPMISKIRQKLNNFKSNLAFCIRITYSFFWFGHRILTLKKDFSLQKKY